MNILHILNGDSTLHGFRETGLEGDTLVWREILSQGPLEADISSGNFWKARAEWIGEAFGEPANDYQESMIDQLARLSEPYDEIDQLSDQKNRSLGTICISDLPGSFSR
jgi:hypothetical protein